MTGLNAVLVQRERHFCDVSALNVDLVVGTLNAACAEDPSGLVLRGAERLWLGLPSQEWTPAPLPCRAVAYHDEQERRHTRTAYRDARVSGAVSSQACWARRVRAPTRRGAYLALTYPQASIQPSLHRSGLGVSTQ